MSNYIIALLVAVILFAMPPGVRAVKMTDYPEDTAPTSDDLLWTTNNPAVTATDKKVSIANLFGIYLGTVTDGAMCFGNSSSQVECILTSLSGASVEVDTASREVCSDANKKIISCDAGTGTGAPVKGTAPTITTPSVTMPTTVGTGAITVSTSSAYVVCTGACQVTLPAAVAGNQFCVRNAPGSATVITLVNRASQYYELTTHAAWATVNQKLVSGGAATDSICVLGYDATHYATMNSIGTWTDTAP